MKMVYKLTKGYGKYRKIRIINSDNENESLLLGLTKNTLEILERTSGKIDEIINEKLKKRISLKIELNKSCYFCDYSEVIERHHILEKRFGGKNEKINMLSLCPNHHYLIHRTNWKIVYMGGFFYLINNKNNGLIKPSSKQLVYKRECPMFVEKFSINEKIKKEV